MGKKKDFKKQYNSLFSSKEEKAKAFDEIAEHYYFGNFGTMQKSDLETLIFSLYLDKILEQTEDDMNSYSDYTLSKYLGITQNRVSALKIKKELKYPYIGFDWKKSFGRISQNARYEDGKIKINIPDKNLYLELKNAIESSGGYVDVQLNPTLLQIAPEYFIDLLMIISEESDRNLIWEKLKKTLKNHNQNDYDIEKLGKKSISEILKGSKKDIAFNIVSELLTFIAGSVNPILGAIANNVLQTIQSKI